MRIASITCVFPPYKGGIGNAALDNAEELKKQGAEIVIFTPRAFLRNKKIPTLVRVNKMFPVFKYGNGAILAQLFWKLKNFDIIHLHYPFFGSAEIVWLLKKFNKTEAKLIITYHMDVIGNGLLGKFFQLHYKFLMPRILSSADKIIVSSFDYVEHSKIKNIFKEYTNKFAEIPFSIDLDRFRPRQRPSSLIKKYRIKENEKIILFVGRLDRAHYFKGVNFLIKAFYKLTQKTDNVRLIIVGDGDMKFEYQQTAFNFGLRDNVIFTGEASNKDLTRFYNLSDIFVLPSIDKSEAFGIVLLEAMASGIPVIASNLPGVRSLVENGINGFLTEPKNADDLTEKMRLILKNDELKKNMGINGRKIAEKKYNPEIIGNKLNKLFFKLSS
ncbi:MAG: glycosyltransferase family 4 protein [Patescibacteria group bacterium]|nr:glycosyltransferase family 4 protein [Patescibacteria group bacterium]